jgi:hypothetical protein
VEAAVPTTAPVSAESVAINARAGAVAAIIAFLPAGAGLKRE